MAAGEAAPAKEEEPPSSPTLTGDVLEAVLVRLPTLDLVPASRVSAAWHRAVHSSLRLSPRRRPWLVILLARTRRLRPAATTFAFDPHCCSWAEFPTDVPNAFVLSSTSSTLFYGLTSSRLVISSDAFHRRWVEISPPRVWRVDPVVAAVGRYVVVAGGVCEFEDDPCAVEVFDAAAAAADDSGNWVECQPMPEAFRCSASSTWLSAAVAGGKLHVIERSTGVLCSFDPEKITWGEPQRLFHDDPSYPIAFSIASSGHGLLLAVLTGDPTAVTGLRIWEVGLENMELVEIGSMPPELLRRLVDGREDPATVVSSIDIVASSRDYAYVYSRTEPEEMFYCEMMENGGCKWGSVMNPAAVDRNPMDRAVFTCSPVGIEDLRAVLRPAV